MAAYGGAQPGGVLARFLAVAFLVGGTYNPSGTSYYHWVLNGGREWLASKILIGLVLGLGLTFCANFTWRSLRLTLLLPGLALILLVIWLLSVWHWIDLADPLQRTLVIEGVLVLVLGIGTAYTAIRFRLTGQMDSRYLT